jgi:hypothetical protein
VTGDHPTLCSTAGSSFCRRRMRRERRIPKVTKEGSSSVYIIITNEGRGTVDRVWLRSVMTLRDDSSRIEILEWLLYIRSNKNMWILMKSFNCKISCFSRQKHVAVIFQFQFFLFICNIFFYNCVLLFDG